MSVYFPSKGDIVWVYLKDQIGYEQQGRRPALVVSNDLFNQKTGMAFLCPITSSEKGYPFHLKITKSEKTSGVVMVDQIKSVDIISREITFVEKADPLLLNRVLAVIDRIIN